MKSKGRSFALFASRCYFNPPHSIMGGPDKLTDAERAAAIAAFEKLGICTQLAEAAAGLGWKAPSHIQEQAIPHLLAGAKALSGLGAVESARVVARPAPPRHPRIATWRGRCRDRKSSGVLRAH